MHSGHNGLNIKTIIIYCTTKEIVGIDIDITKVNI
jgi:hypothetical protein